MKATLQSTKYFDMAGIREDKMQFVTNTQDNVLIITPETSRLDVNVAPTLKEELNTLLEGQGNNCVVFDLHRVQFIDSSGLGTLLSALRILHHKGGELKLACMNKPVRTMFELVSMHKVFEIFNSTHDAVRSFK
jgi:anti-anti-sigma factor